MAITLPYLPFMGLVGLGGALVAASMFTKKKQTKHILATAGVASSLYYAMAVYNKTHKPNQPPNPEIVSGLADFYLIPNIIDDVINSKFSGLPAPANANYAYSNNVMHYGYYGGY